MRREEEAKAQRFFNGLLLSSPAHLHFQPICECKIGDDIPDFAIWSSADVIPVTHQMGSRCILGRFNGHSNRLAVIDWTEGGSGGRLLLIYPAMAKWVASRQMNIESISLVTPRKDHHHHQHHHRLSRITSINTNNCWLDDSISLSGWTPSSQQLPQDREDYDSLTRAFSQQQQ